MQHGRKFHGKNAHIHPSVQFYATRHLNKGSNRWAHTSISIKFSSGARMRKITSGAVMCVSHHIEKRFSFMEGVFATWTVIWILERNSGPRLKETESMSNYYGVPYHACIYSLISPHVYYFHIARRRWHQLTILLSFRKCKRKKKAATMH